MPTPGTGFLFDDPIFINAENNNFEYSDISTCIDAGDPEEYDEDGTRSDIGANPFIVEQLLGDCNADNEQNVVDIIFNINNCIINYSGVVDCGCSDLNGDNDYNVLDVVILVNIILYN